MGLHPTLVPEYERVAFDKALINPPGQVLAEFVCPGHPLLDATIDLLHGAPPRPAPAGRGPRGRHRSRHRPAGARDARAHHHRRPDALGRPAADHLAPHGVRRAAARRQLDTRRPGALPRLRPRDRRGDHRGCRCPPGVLAHGRARGPRGLLRDRRPRARAPRRGSDADRGARRQDRRRREEPAHPRDRLLGPSRGRGRGQGAGRQEPGRAQQHPLAPARERPVGAPRAPPCRARARAPRDLAGPGRRRRRARRSRQGCSSRPACASRPSTRPTQPPGRGSSSSRWRP